MATSRVLAVDHPAGRAWMKVSQMEVPAAVLPSTAPSIWYAEVAAPQDEAR